MMDITQGSYVSWTVGSHVIGLCVLKTISPLLPNFPGSFISKINLVDQTIAKETVVPRSQKSNVPLFNWWFIDCNHKGRGTLT